MEGHNEFIERFSSEYEREFRQKTAAKEKKQREEELLKTNSIQAWIDLAGIFNAYCKLLNQKLGREAFQFEQMTPTRISVVADSGARVVGIFDESYGRLTFEGGNAKDMRAVFRLRVDDGVLVFCGDVNGSLVPHTPEKIFERVMTQE